MTDEDFDYALKAELEPGEKVVWQDRPDSDALRSSLVVSTVIWMSGLFMFGAGLLRSQPYDSKVLVGLIVILVLITVAGFVEVIIVPKRANQTIYLVTDRRVISLCIVRKFGSDRMDDSRYSAEKTTMRENKNSASFYLLSSIPSQIFFLILAHDVCNSLIQSFDIFILVGFLLTMTGWLLPWYFDMRLPLPRFRDCSRIFYEVGNYFIFLESIRVGDIAGIVSRKTIHKTFNYFLVSKKSGCVRFRAITKIGELSKLMPPPRLT